MASELNDPKLLYAIKDVQGYHIVNGAEEPLTPSGPQTLSLLMVPTSIAAAASVTGASQSASLPSVHKFPSTKADGAATPPALSEQDFYLHLHLPPELDLPLPATTQIYHQPPASYLIPRWDLGPDSGAFTRIEFPRLGARDGVQEDVDTFETILAQCTSFLERSPPPKTGTAAEGLLSSSPPPPSSSSRLPEAAGRATPGRSTASATRTKEKGRAREKAMEAAADELPPYNPADFAPGEAYVTGSLSQNPGGKIVLVDQDGSVVGELGDEYQVVKDDAVQPGSKDPVEISLPTDGAQAITVSPASEEYIEMEMHPSYKNSSLVSGAAKASRLIVTTSDYIARGLQSQADNFTKSTKPAARQMTFTPTVHTRVRQINQISAKAAGLSAATVNSIANAAQRLGAGISRKKDGQVRGFDKDGVPIPGYKPGLLNRSLMAVSLFSDGVGQAGNKLVNSATSSVDTMVDHRWGKEASQMSRELGASFKNVGVVYIDVTGVSRRAVLKNVGRGMVVGKVANGGGKIIVGGDDGGSVMLPTDPAQGNIPGQGQGQGQVQVQLEAAPSNSSSQTDTVFQREATHNGTSLMSGANVRDEKKSPLMPAQYS